MGCKIEHKYGGMTSALWNMQSLRMAKYRQLRTELVIIGGVTLGLVRGSVLGW